MDKGPISTSSGSVDLLDEIVLGSARGGKAGPPLQVSIVRALTEADLPALQSPGPAEARPQTLLTIRHTHHLLAQLLAKGTSAQDASLITGYSGSYISILKGDPAFGELLAHYGTEREAIFTDMVERMQTLGLSFVDELQSRLELGASGFTNREVMEAIELLGLKSRPNVGQGGSNGPAGINIQVSFDTPSLRTKLINRDGDEVGSIPLVDVEFSEIIDGK